jgi:hypothetical protein
MISATSEIDRNELEALIGEARDYSVILQFVVQGVLSERSHVNGVLIRPPSGEEEQAVVFATILAREAAVKLYDRFHGIEAGEES